MKPKQLLVIAALLLISLSIAQCKKHKSDLLEEFEPCDYCYALFQHEMEGPEPLTEASLKKNDDQEESLPQELCTGYDETAKNQCLDFAVAYTAPWLKSMAHGYKTAEEFCSIIDSCRVLRYHQPFYTSQGFCNTCKDLARHGLTVSSDVSLVAFHGALAIFMCKALRKADYSDKRCIASFYKSLQRDAEKHTPESLTPEIACKLYGTCTFAPHYYPSAPRTGYYASRSVAERRRYEKQKPGARSKAPSKTYAAPGAKPGRHEQVHIKTTVEYAVPAYEPGWIRREYETHPSEKHKKKATKKEKHRKKKAKKHKKAAAKSTETAEEAAGEKTEVAESPSPPEASAIAAAPETALEEAHVQEAFPETTESLEESAVESTAPPSQTSAEPSEKSTEEPQAVPVAEAVTPKEEKEEEAVPSVSPKPELEEEEEAAFVVKPLSTESAESPTESTEPPSSAPAIAQEETAKEPAESPIAPHLEEQEVPSIGRPPAELPKEPETAIEKSMPAPTKESEAPIEEPETTLPKEPEAAEPPTAEPPKAPEELTTESPIPSAASALKSEESIEVSTAPQSKGEEEPVEEQIAQRSLPSPEAPAQSTSPPEMPTSEHGSIAEEPEAAEEPAAAIKSQASIADVFEAESESSAAAQAKEMIDVDKEHSFLSDSLDRHDDEKLLLGALELSKRYLSLDLDPAVSSKTGYRLRIKEFQPF